MRNLYIAVITFSMFLPLSCSAQKKAVVNQGSLQSLTTRLQKAGVHEYLIYTTSSPSATPNFDCPCAGGYTDARVIYSMSGKTQSISLHCCKEDTALVQDNSFLARIRSYSSVLSKQQNKGFYPPVATDQEKYSVEYIANGKQQFQFSLSKGQITDGTEENKAWSKVKGFKAKQQILDYINSLK